MSASLFRRAFSLRENARRLLVPPGGSLRPVDGLRAIAVLWVFFFHAWWFLALFVPAGFERRIAADPAFRLVACGDLGVDCFFTISGFLIADLLIAEYEQRRAIAVARFELRRAMRILPAYLIALAIYGALGLPNRESTWANVLLLNDFVPVARQCMPWSWSIAVEEQFYLMAPPLLWLLLLLRPERRLRLLIALIALSLALSVSLVIAQRATLPIPVFPALGQAAVEHHFDTLYDKPWARLTPLLIGVTLAHLRRRTEVMSFFSRSETETTLLSIAALTTIAFVCLYPSRDPDRSFGSFGPVYLAIFRSALSASVAWLLLVALSPHPLGRRLDSFLSSRCWYPIAQLSYSIYLLHPIVIIIVYRLLPPDPSSLHRTLLTHAALSLALTLVAATLLFLAIERPFMNLRPTPGFVRHPSHEPGTTVATN